MNASLFEFEAVPEPTAPPPMRGVNRAAAVIDCEVQETRPRPLHVAVSLGGTDFGRSGIGTYAREVLPPLIAQVLADGGKLTAFGHARELAAFSGSLAGAAQRRLRGVPLTPALNALWHLRRAGPLARQLGADVLLLPAANRRIVTRSPVPVVGVVHDLAQLRVDQKYDWLRMFYFRRFLLPAFRRPDRIVAISSATRHDLTHSLGISEDRIRIVYNGVNTAQYEQLDGRSQRIAETRHAMGLGDKPYLLYPARLEHPAKNHVRLLGAFAKSGLSASHTLALSGAEWGGGPLIEQTIRELGLERSVKLLGFVAAEQMPALIAGADAVLMLGLHEGFGLPALEGLCAGRPVCVSSTGALPEVVGRLGVQCDPLNETAIADALRTIVTDAEIRTRCETEGPTWSQRFTWPRTAQGLLDACHEAIAVAKGA